MNETRSIAVCRRANGPCNDAPSAALGPRDRCLCDMIASRALARGSTFAGLLVLWFLAARTPPTALRLSADQAKRPAPSSVESAPRSDDDRDNDLVRAW